MSYTVETNTAGAVRITGTGIAVGPTLPELREALVAARSLLRCQERNFKIFAARLEQEAIEEHGGWTKEQGANERDRERLLLVWLELNALYQTARSELDDHREQVEGLSAKLENAMEAWQERHDEVIDRFSAAQWLKGSGEPI